VLPQQADYLIWNSTTHYSNVADNEHLYLLYGDNESLHKASFDQDYFNINQVFDDNLRDYWVLGNGDIVSKSDLDNKITWVSALTDDITYYDNSANYQPFVHDGKLYAVEGRNMFLFIKTGLVINTILTTWETNGYQTMQNSVKRNGYEMHPDCSTYYFDQSDTLNPVIVPIAGAMQNSGFVSSAGQNALFCVYAAGLNDSELPQFIYFDTTDLSSDSITASAGSVVDAMQRLVVISDNQLMYYSVKKETSFNEYYINLVDGTEQVKQNTTGTVSIIKMQFSIDD
ncbi:MAG: hypothetical protein V7782_02170, partial [Psychromonas sp.]